MARAAAFCTTVRRRTCGNHQRHLYARPFSKTRTAALGLLRKKEGRGYDLLIQPALEDYPIDDEIAAASYMNKVIEKEIMRAPEQYLWLHRRFKPDPLANLRCINFTYLCEKSDG